MWSLPTTRKPTHCLRNSDAGPFLWLCIPRCIQISLWCDASALHVRSLMRPFIWRSTMAVKNIVPFFDLLSRWWLGSWSCFLGRPRKISRRDQKTTQERNLPVHPSGKRVKVDSWVVRAKSRGKSISCLALTAKKRACRRSAARVYHRTHIGVRERHPSAQFGQVQRSAHRSNTRLARRLGGLT